MRSRYGKSNARGHGQQEWWARQHLGSTGARPQHLSRLHAGKGAEEVEEKIQSNVITRAVGPESAVEVDVQEIVTERDDLYLLCSDGLTDMVNDVTLAEILCENKCDLAMASRMSDSSSTL